MGSGTSSQPYEELSGHEEPTPVESHGTKRQRTDDGELRAARAAKRLKETQHAPEHSPEPRKETDGDEDEAKRYGVPSPLRRSQLDVRGKSTPPVRGDDKEGHYCFALGENLTKRFKILKKLGEGTFGRVLECWDRVKKQYVAIKIVRNVPKYREAAMIELEVLNTLQKNDPSGSKHCVHLLDWFDYRGHVCMVFERLGPSLYDFLRKNGYRPFGAHLVREVGRQLLQSVAYQHGLGLVHTDLKPENVLLASGEYSKVPPPQDSRVGRRVPLSDSIRVIDFGSATYDDQYHSTVVSTRHYRAPEVILGLGWSFPCDIWSVGCILVELLTGDALFQTHDNLEHLAMMDRVLGPLPQSMVLRAKDSTGNAARFFHRDNTLNWPEGAEGRKSVRAVKKLPSGGLRELLREGADVALRPYLNDAVDLLTKLLAYEPQDRLTAREALQHSYFTAAARTASPSVASNKANGSAARPPAEENKEQGQNGNEEQEHKAADAPAAAAGRVSGDGGDGGAPTVSQAAAGPPPAAEEEEARKEEALKAAEEEEGEEMGKLAKEEEGEEMVKTSEAEEVVEVAQAEEEEEGKKQKQEERAPQQDEGEKRHVEEQALPARRQRRQRKK